MPSKTKKLSLIARIKKRLQEYLAKRPHRSFRKTDRPRKQLGGNKLVGPLPLIKDSFRFILENRNFFFVIAVVYGIVSYMSLGGISQDALTAFRQAMTEVVGGQISKAQELAESFAAVFSGDINSEMSDIQRFIGAILAFVFWLAIVWAVRAIMSGAKVKVRDALYNCCAPLVPTAIMLGIIILQLLPAGLGVFVFMTAQGGQILQGGVEVMMFASIAVLLSVLSYYWLTSSIMALVIVTLPGMRPVEAFRNAGVIVIGQRIGIALRLILMVFVISVVWALVILPMLLFDAWLALDWLPLIPITYQLLVSFSLIYGSVYLYKMYRSLI